MIHGDFLQVLGRHIRRWRLRRHLTQASLTAQIGIQKNTLSEYERGRVDIPTSRLCLIAVALEISL